MDRATFEPPPHPRLRDDVREPGPGGGAGRVAPAPAPRQEPGGQVAVPGTGAPRRRRLSGDASAASLTLGGTFYDFNSSVNATTVFSVPTFGYYLIEGIGGGGGGGDQDSGWVAGGGGGGGGYASAYLYLAAGAQVSFPRVSGGGFRWLWVAASGFLCKLF